MLCAIGIKYPAQQTLLIFILAFISIVLTFGIINYILPKNSLTTSKSIEYLFANDPKHFRSILRKIIEEDNAPNDYCIVVDNIDRLSPQEAIQVLKVIKTFIVEDEKFNRLVFLVPCDPQQITRELISENDGESQKNETLRKYFNVVLNIPQPIWCDLQTYIMDLLDDTDLPLTVNDKAEIASSLYLVYGDNPRQAKQFINNLIVHYQLAEEIEKLSKDSISITDNIPLITFYLILLNEMRGKNIPKSIEELRDFKNESNIADYISAKQMVWENITNDEWERLLYIKSPNAENKYADYRKSAFVGNTQLILDEIKNSDVNIQELLTYLKTKAISDTDKINLSKVLLELQDSELEIPISSELNGMIKSIIKTEKNEYTFLPPKQLFDSILKQNRLLRGKILTSIHSNLSSDSKLNENQIKSVLEWTKIFIGEILKYNENSIKNNEIIADIVLFATNRDNNFSKIIIDNPEQAWNEDSIKNAITFYKNNPTENPNSLYQLFVLDGKAKDLSQDLIEKFILLLVNNLTIVKKETGEDKTYLDNNTFDVLNKLILDISNEIIVVNGAFINTLSNSIESYFDDVSYWDAAPKLLELHKLLFVIVFIISGIDKALIITNYKNNVKTLFDSDAKKYINNILDAHIEFISLHCPDLLETLVLKDKDYCFHILENYEERRLGLIKILVNNDKNYIKTWMRRNKSIMKPIELDILNHLIPKAIVNNKPVEKYCRIISYLPIYKISDAFKSLQTSINSMISTYQPVGNYSENSLNNIMDIHLWVAKSVAKVHLENVKKSLKELPAADKKSLNPKFTRFKKLGII